MSSTVLVNDELCVGMFITIFRGKMAYTHTNQGVEVERKETGTWDHFKGRVLKIVAVDFPYIIIEYYVEGFDGNLQKTSLDTRDLQLKKCNKNYVEIYEPRFEVIEDKPSPDWEFDQEKK